MSTSRDPAAHPAPIEVADDTTAFTEQLTTPNPQHLQKGTTCPGRDSTAAQHDSDPSDHHLDSTLPTTATNDADTSAAAAPEARQQDTSIDIENNGLGRRRDLHTHDDASYPHVPSTGNISLPVRTVLSGGGEPSQNLSLQAGHMRSGSRRHDSATSTRIVGSDDQVLDVESIMMPPQRSSSMAQNTTPPHHSGRRNSLRSRTGLQEHHARPSRQSPVFILPRWQPDSDVTLCPICNTQFSIWIRKHHCRKCGRVVCNSCSPHRIIIPNQFIVRPPGSETPFSTSLFTDYQDADGMSGGDRVRLCNPCVPDPNTAPPHSPAPMSPRLARHISLGSLSGPYGGVSVTPGRYGGLADALQAVSESRQHLSPSSRNIAVMDSTRGHDAVSGSSRSSSSHQTPFGRYMSMRPGNSSSSQLSTRRPGLLENLAASPRHRALPPTPRIAEEDECPVCHGELPRATLLSDSEALREQHITLCIQSHSTYGGSAPPAGDGASSVAVPAAPRRTGMYTYAATEKDCVDDAECTICLEEFIVGVPMARLECLCRFHRACIAAWFVNHPGRCPVHQHDGFGF